MIRRGLPVGELNALQSALDITSERLALLLGISKATLHRMKAGKRLTPTVSDRIVRLAQIFGYAITVFDGLEHARKWFAFPQFGLGGAVPLDYAATEIGALEVEKLISRIDFGVYA